MKKINVGGPVYAKASAGLTNKQKINVGGQAVIEGVMMIAPEKVAIAVRNPEGKIIIDVHKRNERFRKNKIFKWFFFRGIVSLIEMLYEGIHAINYSAKIAFYQDIPEKKKRGEGFFSGAISFLGILLALFIFLFLPIFIASKTGLDAKPILFNIVTGAFRILFFILYIVIISFIPEIKRLFQYHGAEHKSIFCWEDGKELTAENCSRYSTKHPRCGTSFVFVVLIVAIIFFAFIDTLIFNVWGLPFIKLLRLAIHLLFLPFLIGISYEIIKFAGKHKRNPILRILLGPGLLFQYVTTKEPNNEQLEVGFAALRSALDITDNEEVTTTNNNE
ncbi:DUF1385 domain-containing protein [candidate division WOR-3 bacterium]|nr:DUF1385 domain-containing protein [candidate division WOR-3 bacterium]